MIRERPIVELVVESEDGRELELGVSASADASVADLISALSRHLDGPPVAGLRSHRLERWLVPDERLDELALVRGDRLSIGDPSEAPPARGDRDGARIELVVVGGPAMGARHPLASGKLTVGRGRDRDITIDDPAMSRSHLEVEIEGDLVRVADAGSTNGTFLQGVPIEAGQRWREGDVFEAGASLLAIERVTPAARSAHSGRPGIIGFNRPPRIQTEPPPTVFEIPTHQRATDAPRAPFVAAGVALVAALILWRVFPDNPTFLVLLLLSPLAAVATYIEERRRAARSAGRSRSQQDRDLEQLAGEVGEARSVVVYRRRESSPDASELLHRARELAPSLWVRRPEDDDFLLVRFGWGDTGWGLELRSRDGGAVPPEIENALRPLHTLPSVPLTFSLDQAGVVGLAGDRPAVEDAARWWIAQIAALHSPAEVSLACLTPHEDESEWGWTRWLPHTSSYRGMSPGEALDHVAETSGGAHAAGRTVLFLHEAGDFTRATATRIMKRARESGIAVVWLGSDVDSLPGECRVIVEVGSESGGVVLTRTSDGSQERGAAEGLDAGVARELALALAPVVEPSQAQDAGLPSAVALTDVIEGATTDRVAHRWRDRARGLRATMGRAAKGIFAIDLVSDGPHALVGGTTGAGKSEFLQTLVASLAASYPPDRLNFLLIDYKGGAAFKDCVRLPHVVGSVTDLDASLAARALASLEAEIRRREIALRDADVADIAELEGQDGAEHPPRLVIVIDEFATLIKELPAFVDGVVDIAQRGRSLGLHLVLATQRPAGAINDAIRANTNLRVALRMADEHDSADVIGNAAAAHIPRTLPGRAFVRSGHADISELQTAYASAPLATDRSPVEVWDLHEGHDPETSATGTTQLTTLVEAVVEAGRAYPPQRSPWSPPLPEVLSLTELPAAGGATLGLVDEPHLQRQVPALFDPAKDGGLMIFGTAGSGKTSLLITIAASLAMRVSPDRLHLYGLDMTTGPLGAIAALPHCGDVVPGDDIERVRKLLFTILREIDQRRQNARPNAPRVVVLVDGYASFMAAFERIDLGELVDLVPRLISDGRGVGIHFVITAERRTSVPGAVASLLPKKVVLRLGDDDDYSSFGINPRTQKGAVLPPGRGFIDGEPFQAALVSYEPDPTAIGSRLETLVAADDKVSRPAPVRGLPTDVRASEMATSAEALTSALGAAETGPAPAVADLRHGHFVVAGPYRSGRSTALAAMATGLRRSTPDARLHLWAPRRSSVTELDVWDDVVAGTDAIERAAALTAVAGGPPTVLFVDDGDQITDATVDRAMEALARTGRDGSLRIVAAAEARSLHRVFGGWLAELKKDKQGLLLEPDLEIDGDLLGAKLPRRTGLRFPPGRGYLVTRGRSELVQVALP